MFDQDAWVFDYVCHGHRMREVVTTAAMVNLGYQYGGILSIQLYEFLARTFEANYKELYGNPYRQEYPT